MPARMTTTARSRSVFAALVLVLALPVAVAQAASSCKKTGLPAPNVTTLMVDPDDDQIAWLVHPTCEIDIIPVELDPSDATGGTTLLNCSNRKIEKMISYPSANRMFLIGNAGLGAGDFSGDKNIDHLLLSWNALTSVEDIVFPPAVRELDLVGNSLLGISKGLLPESVKLLYLNENSLQSLKNFALPKSLVHLYARKNEIETVTNDMIPEGLVGMYLDGNPVSSIDNVTFPDSVMNFSCVNCDISTIHGVQFSARLKHLNLDGNRITNFEIRKSDTAVLQLLDFFLGDITQTTCEDPNATKMVIPNGSMICVLSDDAFDLKYRPSSLSESTPSPDLSGSESGKTSGSDSSSNSTIIIGIVVAGVVLVLVIALIAYRIRTKAKTGKYNTVTHVTYQRGNTQTTTQMMGTNASAYNSQEYLSNDVRNDELLIPFRIGQNEIVMGKVIAKGGFGVVYMATFRDRSVAVKQLLPEKARNNNAIKSFMDEIRMCAQLDHPKVVQFVGIAWSNLLDIAVVTEFMGGGDLTTALQAEKKADPRSWYEPSTRMKSKSLVAMDIAEALVYLHSFESPILHRDLKTRNVLLNDEGVAKLSDFGISREMSLDETMTGEIGTVAWIAPEVLQGERYSEKADIYSFGVVMSELDTCQHPYNSDIDPEASSRAPSSHTNTQIAMMVSAGKLKPTLTKRCPPEIKQLAAHCVSYNAADRPTAIAIHYELRNIQRKYGGDSEMA